MKKFLVVISLLLTAGAGIAASSPSVTTYAVDCPGCFD